MNNLQANINNQQANSGKPQAVAPNVDSGVLTELRDTIRLIKSETNTLLQKSVRISSFEIKKRTSIWEYSSRVHSNVQQWLVQVIQRV